MSFRPLFTAPPPQAFQPLHAAPSAPRPEPFAAGLREATKAAVDVSRETLRADLDTLPSQRFDEARMARVYRTQAHDLLEAAALLAEAAEAAASGDLTLAAAFRVKAGHKIRPLAGGR